MSGAEALVFPIGQHDPRRIGSKASLGHALERLFDDARTLPHLFHAHLVARVNVVLGAGGHFKIEPG